MDNTVFDLVQVGEDTFMMLVPPARRPLINGKTGSIAKFNRDQVDQAMKTRHVGLLPRDELTQIMESLIALEKSTWDK